MSKSVCIVRQSYFPAEAHVRKNVDALVDAGFRVDVVCLREEGARGREAYRGGTVYRLPLTHRRTGKTRYLFEYVAFFVMAFALLAYRSLRGRYDIVEVYNMPDFLVFSALPAKLRGSKVLLYMFELMPEHAGDQYALEDGHPLIRLLRWIERQSLRFADHVIVVSSYQKAVLLARTSPRAEPTVILNVPEEALFGPQHSSDGSASNEAFRVITHGSILRRYGIDTLIRATPHLLSEIPNLEVWILGEGEYRPVLQDLAKELGVHGHVRFIDWMPIEQVPGIIAQADLGVVPTSLPWLLTNKLFEYVAMDKAVVASASPSVSGIFPEEAIAYFWPNDERDLARRILELHADPTRAQRMARNARHLYEGYRWAAAKRTYVDLHEQMLPSPPAAGGHHGPGEGAT